MVLVAESPSAVGSGNQRAAVAPRSEGACTNSVFLMRLISDKRGELR